MGGNKEIIEYLLSIKKFENKWNFHSMHPIYEYNLLHSAADMNDINLFKMFAQKIDPQKLPSMLFDANKSKEVL